MASKTESGRPRPRLGERELLPGLRLIRARAIDNDFRRHSHRSVLLGVVQRGRRRLLLPDGELSLGPGDGFYLPPGLTHRCLVVEAHDYRVVSISPELWRELGRAAAGGQAARLPAGSPALLAVRRLLATLCCNPEPLAIDSDLLAVVDAMGTPPRPSETAPAIPDRVLRVRDWLDRNCTEAVRLPDLATIANCSPRLISCLFTQFVGLPPYEYLMQRRLGLVAERLRDGAESLADIAYATGFADQSHLQRLFRRAYGTTPLAYRCASSRLNQPLNPAPG